VQPPGRWAPRPDADERRRSAIRIAKLVLAADGLVKAHRDELLSIAIWKYTEVDGKFTTRFRSAGAVAERDIRQLNHEHVFPRKWLRERLLADPSRCEATMAMAVGCVVTRDEHAALTAASRADPSLEGWARYVAAGVEVFDMATGARVQLPPPQQAEAQPALP
jgi:hypothetical protein